MCEMEPPTPGVETTAGKGLAVSRTMIDSPTAKSPTLEKVSVCTSPLMLVAGSRAADGALATLTNAELAT